MALESWFEHETVRSKAPEAGLSAAKLPVTLVTVNMSADKSRRADR